MRIAWWWMLGAALAAGCTGGAGGAGGASGAGGCPSDLPPSCPTGAAGFQATVAPIFVDRCGYCHAPGGTSVHYLQTYAQIDALRGAVLDQVYACKMPPPGYAPLTSAERADLLGWLVCGAPDD